MPRRTPLGAPLRQQGASDEPGISAAPPAFPLGPGDLRILFQDLLGRPPLAAERGRWLGRGRPELLTEVLASEDFWRAWLEEQLYYFLLIRNFRPESDGVTALPAELAAGRAGAIDALHRIALSPAFDQRNPGADTFVTVVMEQLLGIEVQSSPRELEIGKALYDGEQGVFLEHGGSSQADVVRIAIEDRRCARKLVAREHARLMRGAVGAREVNGWARDLENGALRFGKLVEQWLLSPAWEERRLHRRPLPNRLFVRTLFVDLVDRLPDDDEMRAMANALDGLSDPGPLRSVLARLLLDSGTAPLPEREQIADPTAWIAGLFERLLGRVATDEELRVFVKSFHDPACRPRTILYAILSHPEYHVF